MREEKMTIAKPVVSKFGGSSLADAGQFRKISYIIKQNPNRRYIVPSAPGKRNPDDVKVTDLLYACYDKAKHGEPYEEYLNQIRQRYQEIIEDLGLHLSLKDELKVLENSFVRGIGSEYAASRGEYLNGILLAAYLDYEFVDAASVIRFHKDGTLDAETTNELLKERLGGCSAAVIPGFYGADENGRIHTFSRGGSDVTGALVARAVRAEIYENWTDVTGFLLTDPNIVDHPKKIDVMTFSELRELAYRGATVLHEDAVYPVRREGIPIHIRNTNEPDQNGTLICRRIRPEEETPITGIAGKKNFVAISIAKHRMNAQVGFCKKLLEAFDENDISFEHMPSGIDTISVIMSKEEYMKTEDGIMESLHRRLKPDRITLDDDLAMVTVVGKGMRSVSGIASRFFGALGDANVNIKMIDMGSNEINCTIGVANADFETAIRALYDALVK